MNEGVQEGASLNSEKAVAKAESPNGQVLKRKNVDESQSSRMHAIV